MYQQINDVIEWAEERGIFEHSDPKSQCLKFLSEAGEVADEVNKGNKEALEMEIGDVIVTLILLCEMEGLDIQDCLSAALAKITKRTGKMENGVFIRD